MKIASLFLSIMLCSILAFSQANTEMPTDPAYYKKYYRPISPLLMSFDIGLSSPSGTFAQAPSPEKSITAPYVGEDGMGAETGFSLGLEFQFAIGASFTPARHKVYPTWGILFSVTHNPINWSQMGGHWKESYTNSGYSSFSAGMFLGLEYNSKDRFALGFAYKLLAPVVTDFGEAEMYIYDADNSDDNFTIATSLNDEAFTFANVTNLYIRNGKFRVAYEFFNHEIQNILEYTEGNRITGTDFNSNYTVSSGRLVFSFLVFGNY